jgi:hypothetical protein
MEYIDRNKNIKANELTKAAAHNTPLLADVFLQTISDASINMIEPEVINIIHAGVCGGHIGARALAAKTLRQGFYWSTMIDDAVKLVATCEACQRFSCKMKAPAHPVQLITPSWPLERWGNDIVRKWTPAQGNYTFAVVAVEYFRKWIRAKPLTNVSSASIKKIF